MLRYAANRSLWLDEAYLTESILTYSARQLATTDFLHWQAAPVGFLLLEKLAVTLLGTGEHALRLVPLLAGVASVPLFYLVVRRSLPAAGGLVAWRCSRRSNRWSTTRPRSSSTASMSSRRC